MAAFEDFENAVSEAAIETVQRLLADAVAPQIATLQADMTALATAIALAEDALATLLSGGVAATNVTIAAFRDL